MYNSKRGSREDEFQVDVVDLPSDERHNAASIFHRLWARILSLLPEIHVTLETPEEPDYDEGYFSYRVCELPDPQSPASEEKRVPNW